MHRHYDTIYLDWEEPAEPNGILTGYILKYQTLNITLGDRILVEYIPPNITYFSLRRFDRYTRYKFSLAAQTETGVGEAFTEESPHFTTEEYTRDQVDIVTQGWFIGLMCAVALLVLIMLIVFFIKRSRGGKYPVRDKKDFALEPMDDRENGTFDYRSLERYECHTYGEEIEFNEDGSFIGEYTGVSKRTIDTSPYHDSSEPTSPVAIYSFA
ncbi:neuronal cell adhesion molecule-like [Sinocyclocheilus grahami]|uniref:neuronal cell adhesion molecule-like n=1 Tax=Sinocyclocheilus grahami TaxID=75366 RepID=UPI0007AD397E|nr:PREDICTED: neuronal cell adhesion molecule-like [Sinocyclocheilus grahami]